MIQNKLSTATNSGRIENLRKLNRDSSTKNIESQVFDLSVFEVKDGMVNLTKIGKHFNKDVRVWTRSKKVKEFIDKLDQNSGVQNLHTVENGQNERGTFGTEKVALKFAEYISTDFEIWANDKIHTLLQTGKVEMKSSPKPLSPAEALLASVQQLVDIERVQKEQSQKIQQVEERVMEIETKATGVVVDITTVKDYKTIKEAEKSYIGREINYYITKKFVEEQGIQDWKVAHLTSRDRYREDTGLDYAGAKFSSIESKKHFLEWIKGYSVKSLEYNIYK
jgi:hypothetical protein